MTNTLNPNKPIKYTLKSNPEKVIYVPLKHAYKAGKIMNLALESDGREEFYNHVSLWPSLNEVYVPKNVNELILFLSNTFEHKILRENFKTYDQAYLETCVHLMNDELASMDGELANRHEYRARERYNAIRNKENIVSALERLE